jgi:hypothetical protein
MARVVTVAESPAPTAAPPLQSSAAPASSPQVLDYMAVELFADVRELDHPRSPADSKSEIM